MSLHQKAADKGNSYATFALGKIYPDGNHVEKDIDKAVALFEKAAEQDNDSAAYALAKLYLQGANVPQNIDKALYWCKIAADHGHAFAQYTMGQVYAKGEEVPADMNLALHYLKLSASQDNAFAKAKLGFIYLFGKNGVEKDEAVGLDYLRQAAEQGGGFAQSVIDSYSNRYSMDVGNLVMNLFQSIYCIAHRKDQHLSAKHGLLMKQAMENKHARKEYAISQTNAGAMDWGDGL